MKRIVAGILLLGMLLMLTACGEAGTPQDTDTGTRNTAPEKAPVTLDETVIFDQANVKVTVIGLGDGENTSAEIRLKAENYSAEAITLRADRASVNGYMIAPRLTVTVAAGGTAEGCLTFPPEELQIAGITTVKDLEFMLHVYHADTGAKIVSSGVIKLKTSATGLVQIPILSGTPLFDGSGIKIYPYQPQTEEEPSSTDRGTDTETGFSSGTEGSTGTEAPPSATDGGNPTDLPADAPVGDSVPTLPEDAVPEDLTVRFYVENHSEKDLTLSTVNVTVNGTETVPAFSAQVPAGKRAFCTLTVSGILLKEIGVSAPRTLSLQFQLNHGEGSDPITADPITVDVGQ